MDRAVQEEGLVPFRYTATQHGGYGGVEMGVIRGGVIKLDGKALVSDPTAGGAIKPYSGTQPAPPAGGVPSS